MGLNYSALVDAQIMIKKDFGDLSDLDEELQNTIVNIYYNAAIIGQDSQKYVLQRGLQGLKKAVIDATFYTTSVASIPELIRCFRDEVIPKGNEKDINFMTEYFLMSFKYRIENVSSKRLIHAKILKFFRKWKVIEINNLHKIIGNAQRYKTFTEWYSIFKITVVQLCPHIKLKEDGTCLIDFMEHEPLERAFRDGIDPKFLGIDYANNFLSKSK